MDLYLVHHEDYHLASPYCVIMFWKSEVSKNGGSGRRLDEVVNMGWATVTEIIYKYIQ